MMTKIEKMNRMRKNIVRGIFVTSVIAFVWYILPYLGLGLAKYSYSRAEKAAEIAAMILLFSFLVFGAISRLIKRKLKRSPDLYDAVYDDRIKLSWLKAYRIAFIVAFISSICWKCYETFNAENLLTLKAHLPNGPFFVLYLAVVTLVGSFLFFSRESKNG